MFTVLSTFHLGRDGKKFPKNQFPYDFSLHFIQKIQGWIIHLHSHAKKIDLLVGLVRIKNSFHIQRCSL